MKRAAAVLAVVTLSLVGIAAPAEAGKGKHKGWTYATVCTAEGQPTLIFPGAAGLMSCPGGYYDAAIVKVRRGSLR